MSNREMVRLLDELDEERKRLGYSQDLLTPGFLKEVIIGGHLAHYVHREKHGPDAYPDKSQEQAYLKSNNRKLGQGYVGYEYLSCKEGGSFQLDRIHEGNLYRITRNDAFFFALFSKKNSLQAVKIYRVKTDVVLAEAKRKIANMKESSKHIGFGQKWTKEHGKLIWEQS